MGALNDWTVVDANNNATPPDGWPENTMQYSEVNNTGRAVQGTLRRFFGDINGSLAAGGVADAYTLTLNETGYTAYFAGMYFACEIMATNTGASTIDVNGIGVQTITDRAGNALQAGELQAGGIYEFRYDGTNFQLMGTVAGAASVTDLNVTGVAEFENPNPTNILDNDVAILVGTNGDPSLNPHVQIGPAGIQGKADTTTEATFDINRDGGDVNIGSQDLNVASTVNLWYSNGVTAAANVVETAPGGIILEGSSGSNTILDFHEVGANLAWRFQWNGANMVFDGFIDSSELQIQGRDAGSTIRRLADFDPDEGVTLYDATGNVRLQTQDGGFLEVRSDGNTDAEQRRIELTHQDGTNRAIIGFNGGDQLLARNIIDSGDVVLQGTDAGSATVNVLFGNPDGTTLLYNSGDQRLSIEAAGIDVWGSLGNDPGVGGVQDTLIEMSNNAGVRTADIGYPSTADLRMYNRVHGGQVRLVGEDTGGTLRNLVVGDPDGTSEIFNIGVSVLRTTTAGAGGIEVNNTLTGGGFERVLTTSDAGGGGTIGGSIADNQVAVGATTANDIEGSNSLTYNAGADRLALQGTTVTTLRVRATGSAAADYAQLIVEQTDALSGLAIVADNETVDSRFIYSTDGAGNLGNAMIEFTDVLDQVKLFFQGTEVANTQLPANDGMQVDDGDGLQGVLVNEGRKLNRGLCNLGGFSSIDFGLVSLVIDGTNLETYNGRRANMGSGDTLRFGSLSGGSFDGCGGTVSFGGGAQNIGCNTGNNVDIWEFDSSGTFTYHNLSGTSTTSVTGPGFGVWMYVGQSQTFCAIFTTS